jgi:hypothetical protein
MTSGKANQLAIVAGAVTCVKCQERPRFGSLQRCKQCLRPDAEVERAAREKLLPAQAAAAPRSNRSQAVARRKATAVAPVRKAPVPVRPAQPVPTKQTRQHQPREMGKPFTVKTWTAMAARWLSRFLAAKPAEQRAASDRAMAAEHATRHLDHAKITYGTVPVAMLYPATNQDLAHVEWGLDRMGVRIDLVDTFGDITDTKRLCPHCHARVRVPCSDSRANSCPNRSRGNR